MSILRSNIIQTFSNDDKCYNADLAKLMNDNLEKQFGTYWNTLIFTDGSYFMHSKRYALFHYGDCHILTYSSK